MRFQSVGIAVVFCAVATQRLFFGDWAKANTLSGSQPLTLEKIFKSDEFKASGDMNPQWLPGGQAFTYIKDKKDIWIYDLRTQTKRVWISGDELNKSGEKYTIRNYQVSEALSADGSQVVFTGVLPARRLKSGGDISIFDLKTRTFKSVFGPAQDQANIQISPDGKQVGFVRAHNLFEMDLKSGKETQLTFDGSEQILNGVFDWVYEEEFSIINAWQWSPDSRHIAFWRLDQTNVPTFPLINYQSPHPEITQMRYPKAGDSNSVVQIGIVDLKTKQTVWVDMGSQPDAYVPRIQWLPSGDQLSVQRLNRDQNRVEVFISDWNGRTQKVAEQTESTWVEMNPITFLDRGARFAWMSEQDGFRHIYLYPTDGASPPVQLTSGNWEVEEVLGVDEASHKVYFTGNRDGLYDRHIYSVSYSKLGSRKSSSIERLSTEPGSHSAVFSPDFGHYFDVYSNLSAIPELRLYNVSGVQEALPESVPAYSLVNYQWSTPESFSFTTTEGVQLNGIEIKPPHYDPNIKYPVLIYVYGGPGYQVAKNQWNGGRGLYHQYLAQRGCRVVLVDNRGTGGRGKAFKSSTYRNLGEQESDDVLETVKYLARSPSVDPNRIGVWGWSYGGYLSSLSACKSGGSLKTCVSVAPVSDWKYYDSIYTERYMGTPQNNPDGYKRSSVLEHIPDLKTDVLLIHGTGDDNVHFQNSVGYVKVAVENGKSIEVMYYPDELHGITSNQYHLFKKMSRFLEQNL